MRIATDILDILADCQTNGNAVFLPDRQLERNTYLAVNKCLTNIGGKWNRKTQGHVFDYDPAEALENLVFTGETEDTKKTFQFFPTPRPVAEIVCDLAEIDSGSNVLEPSIGRGDLADVAWQRGPASLYGVELNPDMNIYLADKPYSTITRTDFLVFAEEIRGGKIKNAWDRVIMNPPFAQQQDIEHIRSAYDILKPGGVLVSILSPSPFFRSNAKSTEFRCWLQDIGADIQDIPAGAFRESGTMIATKIIKIRKRGAA